MKKYSINAPFTHNLFRLAEQCELELTDDISDKLDFITTFNIEARYDDYKKEFYSNCTYDFTKEWINNIEGIIGWLNHCFKKCYRIC